MANLIGLMTKVIMSVFIWQKATDSLFSFSWVLLVFWFSIFCCCFKSWFKDLSQRNDHDDLSFPLLSFPGWHSNMLSFAWGIQRRACIDFCLSADRQAGWAGIIFTFLICLSTPCCGRSSSLAVLRLSCAPGVAAVGWPLSQLVAVIRQLCSKLKKTLHGQH